VRLIVVAVDEILVPLGETAYTATEYGVALTRVLSVVSMTIVLATVWLLVTIPAIAVSLASE
jgi:hypothetical protein